MCASLLSVLLLRDGERKGESLDALSKLKASSSLITVEGKDQRPGLSSELHLYPCIHLRIHTLADCKEVGECMRKRLVFTESLYMLRHVGTHICMRYVDTG